MNRMTTVAVNVTGAAANVISFVSPVVALGIYSSLVITCRLNSKVHQNSSAFQSTDFCFEEEHCDSNIFTARSEPSPVKADPDTRHQLPDPDTLFKIKMPNQIILLPTCPPFFDPGARDWLSPSPP
jgi:hypothetical protein